MREILRIQHAVEKGKKTDFLRDYNLEVYEGEIVCIRGVSGSGIHSLLEFLEGRMVLSGGSVYVEEHEVSLSPEKTLEKYGIYAISEKMNLAENLTVSENLELFGKKMPLWGYYNR
jgi:ABC-type lipoprotein export system ATPase subunit